MCVSVRCSQRPTVSPILFGAMTEDAKIESVSLQFGTLQGQTQTLSFPRGSTLGDFLCTQDKHAERRGDSLRDGVPNKHVRAEGHQNPASNVSLVRPIAMQSPANNGLDKLTNPFGIDLTNEANRQDPRVAGPVDVRCVH